MGRRLARRQISPDLIISSTAVRALSTARAVAREISYPETGITGEPALYLASPRTILEIARRAPADAVTVMLVGHNPGMTEFANLLDDLALDNMPTAAMLCVEFDADGWSEIEPSQARFCWFDYPKKPPA
jgi:phosphohistidine phosphatase